MNKAMTRGQPREYRILPYIGFASAMVGLTPLLAGAFVLKLLGMAATGIWLVVKGAVGLVKKVMA